MRMPVNLIFSIIVLKLDGEIIPERPSISEGTGGIGTPSTNTAQNLLLRRQMVQGGTQRNPFKNNENRRRTSDLDLAPQTNLRRTDILKLSETYTMDVPPKYIKKREEYKGTPICQRNLMPKPRASLADSRKFSRIFGKKISTRTEPIIIQSRVTKIIEKTTQNNDKMDCKTMFIEKAEIMCDSCKCVIF